MTRKTTQRRNQPLTLGRLAARVAALAPPDLAEEWDNVGLQIGDPRREVRRAMTCLELTAPTLAEARRRRADAIVAHHPLVFRPLRGVVESEPAQRLVAELIRAEIGLIAAHTNLDSAAWGTNEVLAEACGLRPDGPLDPRETDAPDMSGAGLGCMAELPAGRKPMTGASLARDIKRRLKLKSIRLSGPDDRPVRRVALCSGSGGSLLGKAAASGADTYITGEASYHHAVEAHQRGIAMIEVGHFESEQIMAAPLAKKLAEDPTIRQAKIEIFAATEDLQPFRYF